MTAPGAVPREELERRLFGGRLERLYAPLLVSGRLSRLVRLLENRHSSPGLCLATASRECATERNHLNACLRELTGWTFHRLLVRRRLLHAVELLEGSDASVTEVALACGFGSVRSFERNFSLIFGETPGHYRRRHRLRLRFRPVMVAERPAAGASPTAREAGRLESV